jgi:glutamine amidotransferase/cyclase
MRIPLLPFGFLMTIYLLDYGAGNVLSAINAVKHLGFNIELITEPSDFARAERIIFPGVGSFGKAMDRLIELGLVTHLKEYIASNRPFLGICVGMQCLFEFSEEGNVPGLGLIPGSICKLDESNKSVPHIGWNIAQPVKPSILFDRIATPQFYFVHSFAAHLVNDWTCSLTTYGQETLVSSIQRGNVFATQFHPEKSGIAGLTLIENFLKGTTVPTIQKNISVTPPSNSLTKRIIACLDVRENDQGDLVVTKGDQYDVREKSGSGNVRNLGKPVTLAKKYFEQGADEITFLNITSFRNSPLKDLPMLQVLREVSKSVFVPLTVGGGIRDFVEPDGKIVPALQVASEYFRSGADKISIGSDAVLITEKYLSGISVQGNAITEISNVYGKQAVVISIDPKRVHVKSPEDAKGHCVVPTKRLGPMGEAFCWYQCTISGGRVGKDIDVVQLSQTCSKLGAGEILLNCMDNDGTNQGYDLELIKCVKDSVTIPVIASSGAGKVEHFGDLFRLTTADAALAAGIFHRGEVSISQVKNHLKSNGFEVR